MNRAEAEQEEELSEWVVIQTSPKSPQSSPILQQSHRRENPLHDDNDEDSVVSLDGEEEEEEEEDESLSTVNLWLPWRLIDAAKERLKNSGFFHKSVEERAPWNYLTRRRVIWSLTIIGGFSLVLSIIYVKLVKWSKRLHDKKLTFLLLLLKEKDEKIKELMIEVGRLKELLSSRRRVQVVRIV